MTTQLFTNDFLGQDVVDLISEGGGFTLDGLTFTEWRPEGITRADFQVNLDSPKSINTFIIGLSNLNDRVGEVTHFQIHASNTNDFVESDLILEILAPEIDAGQRVFTFPDSEEYLHYQITMILKSTVSDVSISILSFGKVLNLPEGIAPSYTPPPLAINATIENNITMGGNFIGRSLTLEQYDFVIKQDNLSPDWVRANWLELLRYTQAKPFFYLWDDTYPEDMVYCWTKGDITPPIYDNQCYMSFSFECNGFIEPY